MIFQAYFQEKDFHKLEAAAIRARISQESWSKFLAYVGAFYCNMSNYHSFGAKKFVPDLERDVLKTILRSNPLYNDPVGFYKVVIDELYPQVEEEIFNAETIF